MKKLECELCEDFWRKDDTDNEMLLENEYSISQYGRCVSCFEEYGETRYPDQ